MVYLRWIQDKQKKWNEHVSDVQGVIMNILQTVLWFKFQTAIMISVLIFEGTDLILPSYYAGTMLYYARTMLGVLLDYYPLYLLSA